MAKLSTSSGTRQLQRPALPDYERLSRRRGGRRAPPRGVRRAPIGRFISGRRVRLDRIPPDSRPGTPRPRCQPSLSIERFSQCVPEWTPRWRSEVIERDRSGSDRGIGKLDRAFHAWRSRVAAALDVYPIAEKVKIVQVISARLHRETDGWPRGKACFTGRPPGRPGSLS